MNLESLTLLVAAAAWLWVYFHPRAERLGLVMQISDEQKIRIALSPKTKAGHVARVDGVPVWSVSDLAVLELQASEDGMSVVAVAKGLGKATVSVKADADLGEGVTTIEASGDIEVLAAQASTLGLEFGAPEQQA